MTTIFIVYKHANDGHICVCSTVDRAQEIIDKQVLTGYGTPSDYYVEEETLDYNYPWTEKP